MFSANCSGVMPVVIMSAIIAIVVAASAAREEFRTWSGDLWTWMRKAYPAKIWTISLI